MFAKMKFVSFYNTVRPPGICENIGKNFRRLYAKSSQVGVFTPFMIIIRLICDLSSWIQTLRLGACECYIGQIGRNCQSKGDRMEGSFVSALIAECPTQQYSPKYFLFYTNKRRLLLLKQYINGSGYTLYSVQFVHQAYIYHSVQCCINCTMYRTMFTCQLGFPIAIPLRLTLRNATQFSLPFPQDLLRIFRFLLRLICD